MILVKLAKATAFSERHLKGHQASARRTNESLQTELRELQINELSEGSIFGELNDSLILYFECECMDVSCTDRVPVSFSEYNSLHVDRNQFIVLPEHQTQFKGLVMGTMKYSIVNKLWKLAH